MNYINLIEDAFDLDSTVSKTNIFKIVEIKSLLYNVRFFDMSALGAVSDLINFDPYGQRIHTYKAEGEPRNK